MVPGSPEVEAQPLDRRRDNTEVLSSDARSPELGLHRLEELASGASAPTALLGSAVAVWHGPARNEAAEVVDPCGIHQLERSPKPLDPPSEAVISHGAPVVGRVPPELAGRTPVIRRDSRCPVTIEQVRVLTVVGGISRHVERHVAEDLDASARARGREVSTTPARIAPDPRSPPDRRSGPSHRPSRRGRREIRRARPS